MSDFVLDMIEQGGYWGIALLMALENIIPPIPSELIMGLGGVFSGQGKFNVYAVLAAGTAGSTAGNYFWYYLGRKLSRVRLNAFVERWGRWLTVDLQELERVNRAFVTHGGGIIFFARCVPGIRTLISLPAGMFDMRAAKFIAWTLAGTFLWNAALVTAGYQLGAHVANINDYLGPISTGVVVLIVVFYIYRVIFWRPFVAEKIES